MLQHHVAGFSENLDTGIRTTFQNGAQSILQRLTTFSLQGWCCFLGTVCNREVHDYCGAYGMIPQAHCVYYMCRHTHLRIASLEISPFQSKGIHQRCYPRIGTVLSLHTQLY